MKTPAFQLRRRLTQRAASDGCTGNRCARTRGERHNERGVTMVLVALCMMALIAMAAMSIDVVTLYLNRQEAQRAADAAALAAARVISISGITGTGNTDVDPASWEAVCGPSGTATQIAQQVGSINIVGNAVPSTPTVTYSAQGTTGGNSDCSALGSSFAINPSVTVQVKRTGLPTMFSRIWSRNTNTVSATATAEAFNPSGSGAIASGGETIPVVPRCVKPLVLPDEDPTRPAGNRFVHRFTNFGAIWNPGISQVDGGLIGETFNITDACGTGPTCPPSVTPGVVNRPPGSVPGTLSYVPALVSTTAAVAVQSCSNFVISDNFQKALAGCDESTNYFCGTARGANADLSAGRSADVTDAMQCITNAPGSDSLITTNGYPFQIQAGSNNPLASSLSANQLITSSNSIITVPLYDDTGAGALTGGSTPQPITIVGFLQVFVNGPTNPAQQGGISVTVLNASGCTENPSTTMSAPGTSPVPIRLITPQ